MTPAPYAPPTPAEQAARCRSLAAMISLRTDRDRLLEMAAEYDAEARK